MGTKKNTPTSIDSLFGSKTRVKLLHLFLNNTDTSYYVREITRLIGEQINSVRRELANLVQVGVITSDSSENKLFYKMDQSYEHYDAFRAIFADAPLVRATVPGVKKKQSTQSGFAAEMTMAERIASVVDHDCVKLVVAGGTLAPVAQTNVDLLLVISGLQEHKALVGRMVKSIEKMHGREIAYTLMEYDEFYYRLSIRDKFVADIVSETSDVIVDVDNIVSKES